MRSRRLWTSCCTESISIRRSTTASSNKGALRCGLLGTRPISGRSTEPLLGPSEAPRRPASWLRCCCCFLIQQPPTIHRSVSSPLLSSHLLSSHLLSSHLISSHLISSHLISSHLISSRRLTDEAKLALMARDNAAGGSSLVANLREKQKECFARPLVRPVPAAGVAHVARRHGRMHAPAPTRHTRTRHQRGSPPPPSPSDPPIGTCPPSPNILAPRSLSAAHPSRWRITRRRCTTTSRRTATPSESITRAVRRRWRLSSTSATLLACPPPTRAPRRRLYARRPARDRTRKHTNATTPQSATLADTTGRSPLTRLAASPSRLTPAVACTAGTPHGVQARQGPPPRRQRRRAAREGQCIRRV